jgi:hypothetical protein
VSRLRAEVERFRGLAESAEASERAAIAKQYPKNPFVYKSRLAPHMFSIGFKTARATTEPLWWTGDGFKDLGRVSGHPEEFATSAEAEQKLVAVVLTHIRKWRGDQAHLILGPKPVSAKSACKPGEKMVYGVCRTVKLSEAVSRLRGLTEERTCI